MKPGELSGREMLEMMARGEIPPPPMAMTIPMRIKEVGEGSFVFEAEAGEAHLNPLGLVHGGFTATVLDSATGCAIHTLLGPGDVYSTLDLSLKMLKPVPREVALEGRARVLHLSSRVGVAEGSLRDEHGNLYAHATATCMIRRAAK